MKPSETDDESMPRKESTLFTTTIWSVVLQAKDKADVRSEAALNELFIRYQKPLYVLVLKAGFRPDEVSDVLQEFYLRLLARDFLKNVNAEKGKFRTFLRTAINNYIVDYNRIQNARVRGGGTFQVSLQDTDAEGNALHEPAGLGLSPDLEYDKTWATTILENARQSLRQEYTSSNRLALYEALEPVLDKDQTADPYSTISKRLGMTEAAVKMAVQRIRQRLRELVRKEVLQTVTDEVSFQEECQHLLGSFSAPT